MLNCSSCTIPIQVANAPVRFASLRSRVVHAVSRVVGGIAKCFEKPDGPHYFDPDATPVWLQSVMSNPRAIDLLRDSLRQRRGGEYLEFLLDYCRFDVSRNPLQRFHLARTLVHVFLRDNAERPVRISAGCRRQLLAEWARCEETGRLPAGFRLPGLEEAAMQVHEIVVRHGPPACR